MPDDFEKRHLSNLRKKELQIRKFYEDAIHQISIGYSQIKWNGKTFYLRDYPSLLNRINAQIKKLHAQIYGAVVTGIEVSWDLSNEKNNILVDKRLAGRKPTQKATSILYDPNLEALNEFIKRKNKGLNLSDRVWSILDGYKTEMEAALGVGISEGTPAAEISRKLKRYLVEPDRLFRRIRQDDGTLKLSNAAKNYHPGQGIYRSSYQNALRVAATETNMAYRTADWRRWQTLPFVLGIEVHLSKNHPEYDICDELEGVYPKDFLFTGWHPRCLCYQTAKQMNDDEYDKFEDAILAGKQPVIKGHIQDVPAGFKNWISKNKKRVEGWKNKPYFMRDNPEYLKGSSKTEISKSFSSKKELQNNIDLAKSSKQDSLDFYKDENGKLTPERQKLHDRIVNHFAGQETTQAGTIFTTGGAPANGKSTLTNAGLLPHPKKILKVDPDEIKKMIPEYAKMVEGNDPLAAAFVHEESSLLGKRIIGESLKRNNDFLIDGVGDGTFESLSRKIKSYQATGKRVRSDYVTLDTDLSIKLAKERAIKTGREVPLDYIKEMNSEISKLIPKLIENNTLDELFLWDTNINGKPRLILSQINGKLKIVDKKLYDNFLRKAH